MNKYNFLAVDLGATSGRAILGEVTEKGFEMTELKRFSNTMIELEGKFYWNVFSLYESILDSLRICADKKIELTSVGIDTWGVDFGCVAEDGTILSLPRAYRDPYTQNAPEEYFKTISKEQLYGKTGIQIMPFNTVFQLYAGIRDGFSPLKAAEKILFIPDLLIYMLTGRKVCEYTIASTSQLLNPNKRVIDHDLLTPMGLNADIFGESVFPGDVIGAITESVKKSTLQDALNVVAVAGHDTASAVAAVPADNDNFAYLSSGTWSLMGIEVNEPIVTQESYKMNFTNEGGIEGTIRFLKNINGMWLLEECRREWEREGIKYTYPQIVEMAMSAEPMRSFINPDDAVFANPRSMVSSIKEYCINTSQPIPETNVQIIRLIFESLALRYREVLDMLRRLSPKPIEKLYVIGGGARNNLLNQFTANSGGIRVIAGPSEATAIGNIMIQAKSAGVYGSLSEMRKTIASTVKSEVFDPQDRELWEEAYNRFKNIKNL